MKRIPVLICCLAAALAPSSAAAAEPPGRTSLDLEMEQFLLTAEVVQTEEIGQGLSKPKRLTLQQGGRILRACFKTVDEVGTGISYSIGFEADYADRFIYEVAAYRVDRLLGMNLVPVVVVREIDGVAGSLQLWIEDAVDLKRLVQLGQGAKAMKQFEVESQWMQILDALIYNTDRNPTNILVLKNGKGIYFIDHSRSFRLYRKLPPWTAKGLQAFPDDAEDRLLKMDKDALLGELEELLGKNRVLAVDKRRLKLLALMGG